MNPFYIYALKDPRNSPAKPFYIGKGTGTRAWEHIISVDSTRKGVRIKEIQENGLEVIVSILAEDLTEAQAQKLEAEIISTFGTEDNGGLLTNKVIPTGLMIKRKGELTVPQGVIEKAQIGLELLKEAILEFAKANAKGIRNADAAKYLGLQSNYSGSQKDYLSWSILGLLLGEGKMVRDEKGRHIVVVR